MNTRVRGVLIGLGLGVAVLLLIELSTILTSAVGEGTSPWWVVACYVAIGALVGVGVAMGRSDRLIPALSALIVVLLALPSVAPGGALGRVPQLGLGPSPGAALAVAFVAAGALVYSAIRGGQA